MTMRAPPLASIAAVAAPKPDAEPVTIAHKPSFDIRISSCCFELNFARGGIPYRAAKSLQIHETPLCGIYSSPDEPYAAPASGPAGSACHGYGFSASLSARKDRIWGPAERPDLTRAKSI